MTLKLSYRKMRYFSAMRMLLENTLANKSSEILVFPHLGYGDILMSVPLFINLSKLNKKLHVLVTKNSFNLVTILIQGHDVNLLCIEDALEQNYPANFSLQKKARLLARQLKIPILFLGFDALKLHEQIRPDYDHNSVFYRLAKASPKSFWGDFRFSQKILNATPKQFSMPTKEYAIVDHFPGTQREIPSSVLKEIESKKLQIVLNPRDVPFQELVHLLNGATELHLTNSALLCFALLLNISVKSKNIYLIHSGLYHGHCFYDQTWKEWILAEKNRIPLETPILVDRIALYNSMKAKAQSPVRVLADKLFFPRIID